MGQADQKLTSKTERYHVIPRSLIFLRNGDDILLLKGSPTKRLWANMFNGVGGHIEIDEDVHSGAVREVLEETGLIVSSLKLRAITNLDAGQPTKGIMMFVFMGWTDSRETVASGEGTLHWVNINSIAEQPMVEDLYWLIPKLLADDKLHFFHYSYNDDDELVIHEG